MTTIFSSANVHSSRYRQGGKTEVLSQRIGWWERKMIPQDDSDIFITINATQHHRPWLIAYDVYGDERLEWVVLQCNNILDVAEEFITGKTIRIPSEQRLKLEIFGA